MFFPVVVESEFLVVARGLYPELVSVLVIRVMPVSYPEFLYCVEVDWGRVVPVVDLLWAPAVEVFPRVAVSS